MKQNNSFKILFSFIITLFPASGRAQQDPLLIKAKEHFSPITPVSPENMALVHLGKALFKEKNLSVNSSLSCNTCHSLDKFGVDNLKVSPGHKNEVGSRNSPSVYNAALHVAQFWDGRALDLETQALGPILNPVEMGMPDAKTVVERISKMPEYQTLFKRANLDITFTHIGKAIGAFERTLVTPSRFDDFLQGKTNALNDMEKKGLDRFIETGCITCHEGKGVGGGMYMKLGVVNEYPTKDLGRYNVTKQEEDKYVFKVPSLRNVIHTAPYLHDGSIDTIEQMIKLMAHHQLGVEIEDKGIQEIKSFLASLSAKKLPQ